MELDDADEPPAGAEFATLLLADVDFVGSAVIGDRFFDISTETKKLLWYRGKMDIINRDGLPFLTTLRSGTVFSRVRALTFVAVVRAFRDELDELDEYDVTDSEPLDSDEPVDKKKWF